MESAKQLIGEKIRSLREILHKKSGQSLKSYADECTKLALLERDDNYVILACIAFSFAKFYEKPYIEATKELEATSLAVQYGLGKASELLDAGEEAALSKTLKDTEDQVRDLSNTLGRHIINLVFKSRLKTAAQMYAHGASLGLASSMCAVDKDELANYIGHTTIPDKYRTISVAQRMEKINAILGGS